MFELFKYHRCPVCGKKHDILDERCPHCKALNEDRPARAGSFSNQATFGHIREFLLGITQFVVTFGIIRIISLILVQIILAKTGSVEAAQSYIQANAGQISLGLNLASDALCLTAIAFIGWKYLPKLLNSFKDKKFLLGIPLGLAMFIISTQLSSFAYDLTGGAINGNSEALDEMMATSWGSMILFTVILAPIIEEIIYRVGIFTFLKRIHPAVAYIGVGLIFGMIHMHNFFDPVEWAYFPGYAFGGIALSFVYDKFGFAGSMMAHMTNNGIAVGLTLLQFLSTKGA